MKTFFNLLLIGSTVFTMSCFRDMPSENSPIHVIFNMDDQEKFEPYEKKHILR